MTVATITGSPAATDRATAPKDGSRSGVTGRTSRVSSPPQVSPTAKASSSLYPKVAGRAVPSARTSWASSNTAPSTQPPDTLPTTSPPGPTAMAAPGARGALPRTATTVASPKGAPAAYHPFSTGRISRTIARYAVAALSAVPPADRRGVADRGGPPRRAPECLRADGKPPNPQEYLVHMTCMVANWACCAGTYSGVRMY